MPVLSTVMFGLAFAATAASALQISGTVPAGAPNVIQGPMNAEENMPVWSSQDLQLKGFQAHQLGGEYLDLGSVTAGGSTVTVRASSDKPAMLYAFVYGCYPCTSTQDGLLSHLLNNEGWRLGYCSPGFYSASHNRGYRLLSFAKDVAAGGEYTLTIPGATEYAAFVATDTFANCAAASGTDANTCVGTGRLPAEHCRWEAASGACNFAYCHGNIGPTRDMCSVPDACAPAGSTYMSTD